MGTTSQQGSRGALSGAAAVVWGVSNLHRESQRNIWRNIRLFTCCRWVDFLGGERRPIRPSLREFLKRVEN